MSQHASYQYLLLVDSDTSGHCVARLDTEDNPLRGEGSTPLEAIASLAERIRQWPIGGAERWMRGNGREQWAAMKRRHVSPDPFAKPEPSRKPD